MAESTILHSPVLLLLFGVALGLFLFDRLRKGARGFCTVASGVLTVVAAAWALILGAGTGEVLTVLIMMLCLHLEGWK